jgi:hypothetical protein
MPVEKKTEKRIQKKTQPGGSRCPCQRWEFVLRVRKSEPSAHVHHFVLFFIQGMKASNPSQKKVFKSLAKLMHFTGLAGYSTRCFSNQI